MEHWWWWWGFWGATVLHSLLGADCMDVFKFTNSSSTLRFTFPCVCILCFNNKFLKLSLGCIEEENKIALPEQKILNYSLNYCIHMLTSHHYSLAYVEPISSGKVNLCEISA